MAFSPIRTATEEDKTRLHASAIRFCERYNINYAEYDPTWAVYDLEDKYLKRLWKACAARALKIPARGTCPEIAFGYVGYPAN